MQAQALLWQFLGLGTGSRKEVHGALLDTYVSIVRALAPEVVLEIGAHEARFSRRVKRAVKDTPVIAFEANPDVWNLHRDRLQTLGVDYRNLAISDRAGRLRFRVPVVRGQIALTTGSLLDFSDKMATEFVEHEVEAVRLDDLGFGKAALWIDVEGATRQVLEGGRELVDSCLCVFIEVEEDERWPGQMIADEVLDHFERLGFVALMRDVQRDWQYNLILVRKELQFDHRVAPFRQRFFAQLRQMAALPVAESAKPAESHGADGGRGS